MSLAELSSKFSRLIYYNAAATGANNGTSPTDAYTTFQAALTDYTSSVTPVNEAILVSHTSLELGPANHWTFTAAGSSFYDPITVITISFADYSYQKTNTFHINTNGWYLGYFDFSLNFYGFGCKIDRGYRSDVNFNYHTFTDCYLEFDTGQALASNPLSVTRLVNCHIKDLGAWNGLSSTTGNIVVSGGLIECLTPNYVLIATTNGDMIVDGFDMSAMAATVNPVAVVAGNNPAKITIRNSKLPLGAVVASIDLPGQSVEICSSDSGSFYGRNELYNYYGTAIATTAVYRVGGYQSKKSNAVQSIEMTATAQTTATRPFSGQRIYNYINTIAPTTYRFQIAHDYAAALTDSDFYIRVYYGADALETGLTLGSSNGAPGVINLCKTSTALSVSAETWVDPGGMTYQQVDVTFTPALTGRVLFVPYLSKYEASKSVFLCPLPDDVTI
ncbi:MAG: hypothetical protein OEW37_00130 [Rhodospirillaceae bacterium]|nr:hypothetical protein [Rhodospirillaceae bacterium]